MYLKLIRHPQSPRGFGGPRRIGYWNYLIKALRFRIAINVINGNVFTCAYHAGVRRFSLDFKSSPAYRSELVEYLYVGAKYIFPSFQPVKALPALCSILSCQNIPGLSLYKGITCYWCDMSECIKEPPISTKCSLTDIITQHFYEAKIPTWSFSSSVSQSLFSKSFFVSP